MESEKPQELKDIEEKIHQMIKIKFEAQLVVDEMNECHERLNARFIEGRKSLRFMRISGYIYCALLAIMGISEISKDRIYFGIGWFCGSVALFIMQIIMKKQSDKLYKKYFPELHQETKPKVSFTDMIRRVFLNYKVR